MIAPRVVVVGSSNTDLVIRSETLPCPGQTVLGGEFQMVPGGKGANQAVAAARAGARVTFVANIGRDDFGDAALARLRRERIDCRFVARSRSAPSGVALILVDARGENLISVAHSSNHALRPAHVTAARTAIDAAGCLVAQLEIPLPAVERAMALAHRHQVPVVLNPAPAQRLSPALLRKVTCLTPNESELAELHGGPIRSEADVERAAGGLVAQGIPNVLVTCGARGVCWSHAGVAQWFKAPKVKAVDTVGAGDCFAGVLAVAIAGGDTMERAIRFAMAAAAISVTRPGAQPSMPRREEILEAELRQPCFSVSPPKPASFS